MTDLAARAWNHSFKSDPIVRTLLDTDFYKLLMAQVIHTYDRNLSVTFATTCRTPGIRLAHEFPLAALKEQLDHARTLRFTRNELVWLAGNTFYGQERIFKPAFLEHLSTFQLPEWEIEDDGDGRIDLVFHGRWLDTTMWEVHALSILNEMRSRAAFDSMGRFAIDVTYARAKARLWGKLETLERASHEAPLSIGDFGTRRRHSHLWQRWCCEALAEKLGTSFTGTSNAHLAMTLGLEALGTNAHELPMVACACADDGVARKAARYEVLERWESFYGKRLRVLLPDAYGTTSFLADAPDGVESWTGARPDSKEPIVAGKELIDWWRSRGEDPQTKLLVFADGMDADSIASTARFFRDRVRTTFGWGTDLTNDFNGCAPCDDARLHAISLVAKPRDAGGRPCVKISDNPAKATGPREEVERYMALFGTAGMATRELHS